jgi:hypothetical protein
MKRILSLCLAAVLLLAVGAVAQTTTQQVPTDLTVATLISHSHTSAATTTITPPAGQYVYVIGVDISNCATGTAVTPAAPTYLTTTGFSGTWTFVVGSGAAAGLCQPQVVTLTRPVKSAAPGTAVTFVEPTFATNQIVAFDVYYYFAP